MTPTRKKAVVLSTAALIAVAACGSSSSKSLPPTGGSSSGGTSTAAKKTVTIGLLTDVTGLAASGNKTSVEGVKAGVVYAAGQGYDVKYVVGDSTSSPAAILAAAQKMVTQQHVDAVVAVSSLMFATAPYLTAKGIPVVGAGEDGPEWITAKNMFSVFGALHSTKVSDTLGKFWKAQGVTTVGAVGYSISPLSSEAAKAAIESGKAAGLKNGYLNSTFPFGGTDTAPVVLGMKSAGVDGFTATTDPNTAFSLVTGLRQAGANVKVAILATGYGGDLLQAGPGALNSAQNVYFSLGYEPIEMNDAATKQFSSDLKAAGVSGAPTFAEYNGYLSVGLLVRGLKAANGSTKSADVITALSGIHDWDALGLFGTHKLDINDRENIIGGADNCLWITKLEGSKFTLVKDATPICGKEIPGVTVSPSS